MTPNMAVLRNLKWEGKITECLKRWLLCLTPNSSLLEIHRKKPNGGVTASGCLSGDSWFAVGTGLQRGSKTPLCKGHQGPFLSAVQDNGRLATVFSWIKIMTQVWSVPLAIFQMTFSTRWSLQEETPYLLILLSRCLVFYSFYLRFKNLLRKNLLLKSVDLLNEDKVFTFSWVSVNCFRIVFRIL